MVMVRDRVHGRGLWLQCRVWGRVNRVSVRVRVRVRVRLVNYVINSKLGLGLID